MRTSDIFDELVKRWPSPLVAREEVERFSGGILHPRTMSNLDSKMEGPKGRIRIGRKIAYSTDELARWMRERAELLQDQGDDD